MTDVKWLLILTNWSFGILKREGLLTVNTCIDRTLRGLIPAGLFSILLTLLLFLTDRWFSFDSLVLTLGAFRRLIEGFEGFRRRFIAILNSLFELSKVILLVLDLLIDIAIDLLHDSFADTEYHNCKD